MAHHRNPVYEVTEASALHTATERPPLRYTPLLYYDEYFILLPVRFEPETSGSKTLDYSSCGGVAAASDWLTASA